LLAHAHTHTPSAGSKWLLFSGVVLKKKKWGTPETRLRKDF